MNDVNIKDITDNNIQVEKKQERVKLSPESRGKLVKLFTKNLTDEKPVVKSPKIKGASFKNKDKLTETIAYTAGVKQVVSEEVKRLKLPEEKFEATMKNTKDIKAVTNDMAVVQEDNIITGTDFAQASSDAISQFSSLTEDTLAKAKSQREEIVIAPTRGEVITTPIQEFTTEEPALTPEIKEEVTAAQTIEISTTIPTLSEKEKEEVVADTIKAFHEIYEQQVAKDALVENDVDLEVDMATNVIDISGNEVMDDMNKIQYEKSSNGETVPFVGATATTVSDEEIKSLMNESALTNEMKEKTESIVRTLSQEEEEMLKIAAEKAEAAAKAKAEEAKEAEELQKIIVDINDEVAKGQDTIKNNETIIAQKETTIAKLEAETEQSDILIKQTNDKIRRMNEMKKQLLNAKKSSPKVKKAAYTFESDQKEQEPGIRQADNITHLSSYRSEQEFNMNERESDSMFSSNITDLTEYRNKKESLEAMLKSDDNANTAIEQENVKIA